MKKIFFSHTPKCGGTYLCTGLSNYFLDYETAVGYGGPIGDESHKNEHFDNFKFVNFGENGRFEGPPKDLLDNINKFKFLSCHYLTNYEKHFCNDNFIVIKNFREPFNFFRSIFLHTLRDQKYQNINLEDYFTNWDMYAFGPDYFIDSLKNLNIDSIYNYFLNDTFNNINKKYDYLVETEDLPQFLNYFVSKYKLEKKRHKHKPVKNISYFDKMKYLFDDRIKNKFKNYFTKDYNIYEQLVSKKWQI